MIKMIFKILFLLLPAFVYGSIRVFIKASTEEESHVEYIGANIDVIGEEDLAAFGFDSESLKQAVKLYTGAEPSHVFVKAPTKVDGEDLKNFYEDGRYSEVTRRVIPMTGSTLSYNTAEYDVGPNFDAKTVMDKIYFSNSDILWTLHGSWKNNVPLSKGDKVIYVTEMGIEKKTSMLNSTFQAPFGKNVSNDVYVFAGKEFDADLQKQKGEFHLKFVKRTIEYQVNYIVSLEGHVTCYYPEEHKDSKVRGFDINVILEAAGKPNKFEISEIIQTVFYTDAEIYVTKSLRFSYNKAL